MILDGKSRFSYVAAQKFDALLALDQLDGAIHRIVDLPGTPTGLALDRVNGRILVSVSGRTNAIVVFDPGQGALVPSSIWPAGSGVCSPVIDGASRRVFVCNRFENSVSILDVVSGRELKRINTLREPVAAALAPGEKVLAVANLLPEGPANAPIVSAAVTLIDTELMEVRTHVPLASGSTAVQGIAVSPCGRWCAAVHTLARFQVPATQVEHGWINASALSLIDLADGRLAATVLLDETRRGAANPSAVCWNGDGSVLVIAHAGTHDLSLIDARALEDRLKSVPNGGLISETDFLTGIRNRIPLRGNGPRSVFIAGNHAYVVEFFTDSVSVINIATQGVVSQWSVGPGCEGTEEGRGERLFHDATLCRQSWQSCASCHPDARMDGLNWDLLNDGIGNPKNTKSLLWSHQTPPAMSSGIRESAEKAVRSGIRHILFARRPEEEAQAMDAYLKSVQPAKSPFLVQGELGLSARRGKLLFEDERVGCAICHPRPLFTDLQSHDMGSKSGKHKNDKRLDTPTLIESWRTAPYLHDGSAVSILEVLAPKILEHRHGNVEHLTVEDLEDLIMYVLSL